MQDTISCVHRVHAPHFRFFPFLSVSLFCFVFFSFLECFLSHRSSAGPCALARVGASEALPPLFFTLLAQSPPVHFLYFFVFFYVSHRPMFAHLAPRPAAGAAAPSRPAPPLTASFALQRPRPPP